MSNDPLVTDTGKIDWPDVAERTYNTLRQAVVAGLALVGVGSGAEAADLVSIDLTLVQQAGLVAAATAVMGVATLADNVTRQWLAWRKRNTQ